jgi:ABC-type branched-subunit amino acid transport system substrate-binding protein
MATPIFTSRHQGTQIKVAWSSGLALILSISALLLVAAQASDNITRIAIIDDFSGPSRKRGDQLRHLFDDYAKATNEKGGISVGHELYKIELIVRDTGGSRSAAAAKMNEAVLKDNAAVAVCSYISCAQAAEQTKTPLILTAAGSTHLSHGETNTFLIWAPSTDDFERQTNLAIKTLHEALAHAAEPTPEKITAALRDLKFTSDLGEVHFGNNNLGKAVYPFRPNTYGCGDSCGSSCPSNCGQTSCTKSDGNKCCSICGMPRPN